MRKKPITLSIVAVIVIAAVAGAVFWIFPVLRVNSIEVTGNERVSVEDVIEDSGVAEGDNLLRAALRNSRGSVV